MQNLMYDIVNKNKINLAIKDNSIYKNNLTPVSLNKTLPNPNFLNEQAPQKIILKNIKEIIQNNKNSRNHKDIIHEDYQTDSEKYNLNNLAKSKTLNSNSTNNQNLNSGKIQENGNITNINNLNLKVLNKYENKSNNIGITNFNINNRKINFNCNYIKNNEENKNTKITNNNIKNSLKINPISQYLIRKKVKSFSPRYKNNISKEKKELIGNTIYNKLTFLNNRNKSTSSSKETKNLKNSFDVKTKICKIEKSTGLNTYLNTETSKDNKPRTRNKINLNKAPTINNNSSYCVSLKKPFNVKDIYNKILSMNNKNKYSILKNWYNEKSNVNQNNSRYLMTDCVEKINETDEHFNENKKNTSKSPKHILKNNSTNKSTNFEKFKNDKVLKKENLVVNSISYSNLNSQSTKTFKKAIINNENVNKNILENSYNFPQANTMIFNNNYFNNMDMNNFKSTGKVQRNNLINNSEEDFKSANKNPKELMKHIKQNLEPNYKNFFNFSYDNYLNKDMSDDNRTASDEILQTQESQATNGVGLNSSKKDKENNLNNQSQVINYTNEISFDDHENKIKNIVFRKKG